jgi:hypothetical protein
MFYLTPPRHISTLPFPDLGGRNRYVRFTPMSGCRQRDRLRPKSAARSGHPLAYSITTSATGHGSVGSQHAETIKSSV